jgi:hypothetical protein
MYVSIYAVLATCRSNEECMWVRVDRWRTRRGLIIDIEDIEI